MSEGFGWVRRSKEDIQKGMCWVFRGGVTHVQVKYMCGRTALEGKFTPDHWYDNGPYTIVAWRPFTGALQ